MRTNRWIWSAAVAVLIVWFALHLAQGSLEGDWWVPFALSAAVIGLGYFIGKRMARRHGGRA